MRFLQDRGFHALRNAAGKMVVVPAHGSENLGIGLVRKILHEAGISLADYGGIFWTDSVTYGVFVDRLPSKP